MLSLAFKAHSARGQANRLMVLPALARPGEILTLMRPAALLAGERSPRDALGDETHVAQVVEIEPFRIEACARRSQRPAFPAELGDLLERALQTRAHAQGTDVLVHHLLKPCNLGRRVRPRNGDRGR